MQIKISLGSNTKSNLVENKVLSFEELVKLLTTYKKVSAKTELPYFVAGHFTDSRRHTETLESRTLIVLDVDKFNQDLNALIEVLDNELNKYKYVVYSTISHTPLSPKIRIIFFLTKEIPVNKYSGITNTFISNLSFIGNIDKCSFKPNQFMYLPGYINDSYEKFIRINDGELINPDDFDTSHAIPYESNDNNLLLIVANEPLNLTNEEVQEYLNQYDVTSTDYYAWIQTGMALHHQFGGSRYGCSLWGKWSLKDHRYEEIDIVKQVKEKWKSFSTDNNNPVTFASIIKIINKQKGKKAKSSDKTHHNIERLPSDIWIDTEGKHKRPLDTSRNLEILLKNYNISVHYDILAKEELIRYPGQDQNCPGQLNDAYTHIIDCCDINKIKTTNVKIKISYIARKNKINPFLDWIKSIPWDKKPRLNDFYDTVQTIEEQNELKKIYLKKWCMSVIQLSCLNNDLTDKFAKGILIFQGAQDTGKTSWFRSLLPKELSKYRKDGITIDPNDTDSVLACIKNIMVELGEIDSTFRKTDIARFKQFITKTNDTLRLKYEAKHSIFTRQTVFFGSVNDHNFLVDETGNSRFMILSVLNVNYNHQIDMQQFWAEIYHYCEQGEQYWLTKEEVKLREEANKNYEQLCPYEEKIRSKFDLNSDDKINMSATRVLEILGYTNITKKQTNAMAKTLDKMGFKRGSSKINGWYLPPEKNIFDFENNV